MPPKKSPPKRSTGKRKSETPQMESTTTSAGPIAGPIAVARPAMSAGELASRTLPDEEVARKAYALWESRGRPFGSPEEDWYRAMQELYTSGDSSEQK